MELFGGVWGGKGNIWLNFGGDPDHHADYPIKNPAITQQIMGGLWWNFQDSSAMISNNWLIFYSDMNHHADSSNR